MKILSKNEYEAATAKTRGARMDWWRQARYGMFVHYGLYSQIGRNEWAMTCENCPAGEYEELARTFAPKPGAPREWAALAKKAGMNYMVLTTRHHEGFSLWDSKANPYNSANLGPKRDIVREFVDACREFGLRIGFYSTLMDWHHPDSWRCALDSEARARFNKYILDLNTELLTQYGKIDVLWYDVPEPLGSWEGWNSLEINQKLRAIQPDIIINDRSRLDEDFGTPEERIAAASRDWEACMTFNGISWGYVDAAQAANYAYNAQGILRMLAKCAGGGGNLLLNIGPAPDGSVPADAVEPLEAVGRWLKANGKAAYGKLKKATVRGNGVTDATMGADNTVYMWNWIWPSSGSMAFGGFATAPKAVRYLHDGKPIDFELKGQRLILKNLPASCPAPESGVTAIELAFGEEPQYAFASYFPQLHKGDEITRDRL
ncbi:MAG: alpha-L-fucosidase [Clostridiales bacterium]|jgi:alpha-L-fucosidase|nr:alpha-L-fucosidase [Clostridiales bacterium]